MAHGTRQNVSCMALRKARGNTAQFTAHGKNTAVTRHFQVGKLKARPPCGRMRFLPLPIPIMPIISAAFILSISGLTILLLREIAKQRPQKFRKQKREYHPLVWTIAWVGALFSNAIARILILHGVSTLQAYLICGIPALLLLRWAMSLNPHASNVFQYKPVEQENDLSFLKKRLINMVYGDRELAYRLVSLEKSRRGGKPEEWYWQAAIDALIRDRR